jgi:hypothetical protein
MFRTDSLQITPEVLRLIARIDEFKGAWCALRQTQGTIRSDAPDWQPWLSFFLRSLAEQVRRLERKVEREKIVLAALPELSLRIVEFAREHGRITMMKPSS